MDHSLILFTEDNYYCVDSLYYYQPNRISNQLDFDKESCARTVVQQGCYHYLHTDNSMRHDVSQNFVSARARLCDDLRMLSLRTVEAK